MSERKVESNERYRKSPKRAMKAIERVQGSTTV
jgi:hypothetical protein